MLSKTAATIKTTWIFFTIFIRLISFMCNNCFSFNNNYKDFKESVCALSCPWDASKLTQKHIFFKIIIYNIITLAHNGLPKLKLPTLSPLFLYR